MKKLSDVHNEINEGLEEVAKVHGFVNEDTNGLMAEFSVKVNRKGSNAEITVIANDNVLYYGAGTIKEIGDVYAKILTSASEFILPFAAGQID